jgi:hypothetical protein
MRFGDLIAGMRGGAEPPPELRRKTMVAILGMHRSGTSAVAGTLADHGVAFGPVRTKDRFNPRGNREIPELNRLHDAVLERNGGSWAKPPSAVAVRPADRRRRNRILETIPGETIAIKDPRMLVCRALWEDLDLKPIGVIRNPLAVRESLARRAAERPHRHPQLSGTEWEGLWVTYNQALLAEHERRPFPIIDFDRSEELAEQVDAALAFWGLEPRGDSEFFDAALIGQRGTEGWRAEVETREAVELWDALAALATG